jgi:CRISPR-associated protein Cmr3
MKTFDFLPADTLFFRDARPLSAGSGYGHGANWPLPTVLHGALRAALLQLKGEAPIERKPGYERGGKHHGSFASASFNWINLHGPFPVDQATNTLYFPIPRDVVAAHVGNEAGAELLRIVPPDGPCNLPPPLTRLAASFAAPGKQALSQWVDRDFFDAYLDGMKSLPLPKSPQLWQPEHRTGIAIDPETQTAAEGQIYAAEHLRLREDIALRFAISEPQANGHLAPGEEEAFAQLERRNTIQLGGERRFGTLKNQAVPLSLPCVKIAGKFVKWVLLTPAIFSGGWLPGWIDPENGGVKLRLRPDGFDRRSHRRSRRGDDGLYEAQKFCGDPIDAKLVAACTGKPQPISGWDLSGCEANEAATPAPTGFRPSPKPTNLAVPSGSVYYFEAADPDEAIRLATVLQGRCRSDFFGEKGLGLGVCGNWKPTPNPDVTGRPIT